MVRELQHKIIVNDRANSPKLEWEGDFTTPEQNIGEYNTERAWETCDCHTNGWGSQPIVFLEVMLKFPKARMD